MVMMANKEERMEVSQPSVTESPKPWDGSKHSAGTPHAYRPAPASEKDIVPDTEATLAITSSVRIRGPDFYSDHGLLLRMK